MKFLGKIKPPPASAPVAGQVTTRQRGNAAEDAALGFLQAAGLQLVARNYRTPGRGGGEIDLVMRDRGGTLVFVEVRSRASSAFGGAGGSIGAVKRQRIIHAISEARAHGDLSENAEYHAAKEAQALNEGRIQELESLIGRADIIDISKLAGSDTIKFGGGSQPATGALTYTVNATIGRGGCALSCHGTSHTTNNNTWN